MVMKFGIIGGGSWATALAKMLTNNKIPINWWVRNETMVQHIKERHHNPNYLHSVYFDTSLLSLSADVCAVVEKSDCLILAVPSAYVAETLQALPTNALEGKKIISAVKGMLPDENILVNEYLKNSFGVDLQNYFSVMGPCHAEKVAAEKLSYLTFSGKDETVVTEIATCFNSYFINTITNNDIIGVQYAAVLKNIYALGAGIAHGLDYGDNFLSVLIANAADEMAGFLKKVGIAHVEVGTHELENPVTHRKSANYAASVYLGDLLVTCYSPFSRNRSFGTMIGKGYSVKTAQLEMNMVAEGYNASKCMHIINKTVNVDMPIADAVYKILWEKLSARQGFKLIEDKLV